MVLKSLEYYDRRRILRAPNKLAIETTKGRKLFMPGTICGFRQSHDGSKMRCILNDDTHKVFTIDWNDYWELMNNSEDYIGPALTTN